MTKALIHPELQSFIDIAPSRPPLTVDTLHEFRQSRFQLDHKRFFPHALAPTCHRIESSDTVVEVYEFKPSHNPDTETALLWIHGGGYITGHGNDPWFGSLFAEQAGVRVFSVHYRLAPEHPFPAARDDVWHALNWLANTSEALGINPTRIAIGGGSAGGGLAAGLALYNRDQSGPDIAFQLLLYPMLDSLHRTESGHLNVPFWTRANSLNAWDMYLNGTPPEPSSVPATAKNLRHLPPAFLCVGEADIFHDEVCIYSKKLEQAEVRNTLKTYPGVFHAADIFGYGTSIGRQMTDDYVQALVNALDV